MAKTLKQQIRKIIKEHYGEDLSIFRADVNYREATESFVTAISQVIKGKIEFQSDWQCDLAKYEKAGSLEIELGKRIRNVRLQKSFTLDELAKIIGTHPDYLGSIEKGGVVSNLSTFLNIIESMNTTSEDRTYIAKAFRKDVPVKDLLRDVIELYYGRNLWTFRPEFEYEESIAPFVQALVDLDQNWQLAKQPQPIMPTLSEMIEIEERRRKNLSSSVTQQKARKTFRVHN